MNKNAVLVSVIVGLLGFIGGFMLANSLNKSEFAALRAESARPQSSPNAANPNQQELNLSDEEIRQRIAEADRNPDNIQFQKNLGTALYHIVAMKKDAKLLGEVARLLTRVYTKNPDDKDVWVTLGHLYFDIGYFQKDNANLMKSREFYEKILANNPGDYDIRTDYALTFFVQNPPENDRAIQEFEKALEDNPKQERALLYMAQALLKQGKTREAETQLAKLKEINPRAPTLSQIQAELAK